VPFARRPGGYVKSLRYSSVSVGPVQLTQGLAVLLEAPAGGGSRAGPYRFTRRRRELGVRRAAPPHPDPAPPVAADLHRWYTEGRGLDQIARQHHTTRDTVRTWLQTAGVSVQPLTSREHRMHLDPVLLRDL